MDEQIWQKMSTEILMDQKANGGEPIGDATYVQIEDEVHKRVMLLEARLPKVVQCETVLEQRASQAILERKPRHQRTYYLEPFHLDELTVLRNPWEMRYQTSLSLPCNYSVFYLY